MGAISPDHPRRSKGRRRGSSVVLAWPGHTDRHSPSSGTDPSTDRLAEPTEERLAFAFVVETQDGPTATSARALDVPEAERGPRRGPHVHPPVIRVGEALGLEGQC